MRLTSIALLALSTLLTSSALAAPNMRLTLPDCVATAMSNNTTLSIARSELEKSIRQREEAFGVALPDFDLNATYTHFGDVNTGEIFGEEFQFQPDNDYLLSGELNQWLYSGSVWAGMRGSKRLVEAQELVVETEEQKVTTEVTVRFYQLLYLRQVIHAHEESVTRLQSHLDDAKKREAVGMNSRFDTLRFETSLAEEAPILFRAKNDFARARAELLELIGRSPLDPITLDGELVWRPFSITRDEALRQARNNRPELAGSNARMDVATEYINAAKAKSQPTLKAFAAYIYNKSEGTVTVTEEWQASWNAGLRLKMNLFDGGERSSRVKQYRADLAIAIARNQQVRRTVQREVITGYDELMRAGQFYDSQQKSVAYATESYRIASERQEVGVATRLELLDTQLSLTRARINQNLSLYEYLAAIARLQRAMGNRNEQ